MQKLKRLSEKDKDYGSGTGFTFFESSYFRVVHWHQEKGKSTVLEVNVCGYEREICFDGHVNLNTNQKCYSQLTFKDFQKMFSCGIEIWIEEGKRLRSEEISKLLGLD